MTRESRKLSPEDCRAVDLFLNHGAAHCSAASRASAGGPSAGVSAAARLIAMLDTLPAAEPPVDLVARTLSRIDAADRPLAAESAVVASSLLH